MFLNCSCFERHTSHRSGNRQPKTYVKSEASITVFELLMMGGVSPETCWAIKKHWNNKFYYTVASCWFFLWDLYYDAQIHEHQVYRFTTASSSKLSPSFTFSYCKPVRIFYPIYTTRIAHIIFPDFFLKYFFLVGGRDSSVGIATRYGLGGPGIKSRCGRDFSHPSRKTRGPPNLLYNGYRVFPGSKAAGAWLWSPTPI